MSEAAIGLIGVVLGAILAGGLQSLRDYRSRRVSAVVGARLVVTDLQVTALSLELAAREHPSHLAELPLTMDHWEEHREALASFLNFNEWRTVAMAFEEIAHVGIRLREREAAEAKKEGDPQDEAAYDFDEGRRRTIYRNMARRAYLAQMVLIGLEIRLAPFGRLRYARLRRQIQREDEEALQRAMHPGRREGDAAVPGVEEEAEVSGGNAQPVRVSDGSGAQTGEADDA